MYFMEKVLFYVNQYGHLKFCGERVWEFSYMRWSKKRITGSAAYSDFTYRGPHLISWRNDS